MKKTLKKYLIRSAIVGSLYLLGNNFKFSENLFSKDVLNSFWKHDFKNITKEPNALENLIKNDSSFYSEKIKAPKYKIKNDHCSEYAVLSAKKLFNKDYNPEHSWNLRYYNKIISEVKNKGELICLAEDAILRPGMIVGFDNPNSRYKNQRDRKGKKAEYTHVSLYLGTNGKDLQFAHQFGKKIEKINLDELINKDLMPKEVLDSEKN